MDMVTRDDDRFPWRMERILGDSMPERLYCLGNSRLLVVPMIAVCGARNASPLGLDTAYRCGRIIAEQGIAVASGYARGVDSAAHCGALGAGGSTVAVLPYGLGRFRQSEEIAEADPDSFLGVSPFSFGSRFTRGGAFIRNRLLVSLAVAVIVVEPGATGGTWYTARFAAKAGTQLYFLEGARPEAIEKLRAIGGRRIAMTGGAPDLGDVFRCLEDGPE